MLSEGALPNLRKLMDEGSWGVIASVKTAGDKHYRPQTAWPSVLSGKLPENHGITEYFHTFRDLRCASLWDYFNAAGLSAGLYSTPILWPPPKINGFVVPNQYARDGQTWPEDLSFIAEYYRDRKDSKLHSSDWRTLLQSAKFIPIIFGTRQDWKIPFRLLRNGLALATARDLESRALILRRAKLDLSTAIFLSLYNKYTPHLSVFTSFEVDYVSHRYWRYHEPEQFVNGTRDALRHLKNAVRDAYANMDRAIGLLRKRHPTGGIVAVVSEHGMAAEPTSREIGRWRYMIDGNQVKTLAGIPEDIVAVPIARWIVFRRRNGTSLERSVADALGSITVSETGMPLFRTHSHGEDEVVVKLDISREHYADIQDLGTLHVDIPGRGPGPRPITDLLKRVGLTRSAMHTQEAVFIIRGPGIRRRFEIQGAAILDVMPTILHACGLEVPPGLDGKVLDIFTEDHAG
jgi:type I phosphodiesterase/nucleotide pyrophosphatase